MEGDISNQGLNSHEDVKSHKMELSHGDEASSNADQGDNNQQEEKYLTNGVHKELSSRRQDGDPSDSSKSHKRLSSSKHRSSHSSKDGHSGSTSKDSLKVNGHSDSLKSKDKSHHISSKSKEGSSKSGELDKHKGKSRGSLIKSDQEKHKEHHGSTKHEGDKKHTSEKNKKELNSSKNDGEKRPNGSGDKKSHSNSGSEKKGSDGDKKHSSSNKQGERKSCSGEKKEHKSEKNNKSKETSSFDGKNRDDSYFKGDSKEKQEKHKDATIIDDDYYYKGELSPVKDGNSDKKENKSEKKEKNKETSLISENKLDDSSDFTKQKSKEKKVKSEKQNHKTDKHDKEKTKKESVSLKQEIVKDEPGSEGDYFKDPKDIKNEADSDSDIPLAARKKADVKKESDKRNTADSDSEDEPLSSRKKKKKVKEESGKKRRRSDSGDDSDVPLAKKKNKKQQEVKAKRQNVKQEGSKRKKKEEEPEEVWKWWEEKKYEDGRKWTTLEHKGPVCAPDYEPLPDNVLFYYDGKKFKLSPEAEEIATFYGKMIDHDYTTKESFNKNFFKDWRKAMTHKERELITDLNKCNFKEIDAYFKQKTEERKAMTKEEKQEVKKKMEEVTKEYGYCIIDGHKEKIGNFKIEPPGLFRGRGEHPKMGMLKTRIQPEDVIINCTKGFVIPPPSGHKWKEVRHDNTVSWLASWTENVQGNVKYIMLNAASRLKGEKDWQKYEMARKLKTVVASIRAQYTQDWRSKEMRIRQRAVALYFIDKLALRAGNEKDEDQADTVGCCSLRVEHIKLFKEREGKEFVVEFDFLGKDSIRYINSVPVEKRVFKNVELFMENKKPDDDLFDRLNTSILNKYLNELMEGLTAKVFRTYNASITLQEQLVKLTQPDDPVPAKILSYNRANRAVAILCNHQRTAPKTFEKSMENLQNKIQERKDLVEKLKKELKTAKKEKNTKLIEQGEKKLMKAKEQLHKQTLAATDKEENKEIALGTSKLNYLDPRISVAWCKKYDVPLEKIYNKTQREKFRWAIDMTDKDFVF